MLRVWDLQSGRLAKDLGDRQEESHAVAFSLDGNSLANAVFTKTGIELWDWKSGKRTHDLRRHGGWTCELAFSSDGHRLFSATAGGTVELWDTENWQERGSLSAHTSALTCMAVSPEEQIVAVGDRRGTVRLMRAATKAEVLATDW
jgi:WD40 repeat protein